MENVMQDTAKVTKEMKFKFAGLYIISIVLLTFIFIVFWHTPKYVPAEKANIFTNYAKSSNDLVLIANQQLEPKLQALGQLDKLYISALQDSAVLPEPGKRNKTVNECKKIIDSIEYLALNSKAGFEKEHLKKTIEISKIALQQHNFISDLYNQATNLSGRNNIGNNKLFELQKNIQEKDKMITSLQNKLSHTQPGSNSNISAPAIQDLQVRNNRLGNALTSIQNRYWILFRTNAELTRNNEILNARLKALH